MKTLIVITLASILIQQVSAQNKTKVIDNKIIEDMEADFNNILAKMNKDLSLAGYHSPSKIDKSSVQPKSDSLFSKINNTNKTTEELSSTERVYVPDIFPTPGKPNISSYFGYRKDPFTYKREFHKGIDITIPSGTNVVATGKGVVKKVSYNKINGNYITIDHKNGYLSWYVHLSSFLVDEGDVVEKFQVIAKSGNTGRSTGPHIHYTIQKNGRAIDPLTIIQTSKTK